MYNNYICTWKGRCSPIEEQSVGAHGPAAMTTFWALKVPLLLTTVTTSPGIISITLWFSSSVPPSFWNCCCFNRLCVNATCKKKAQCVHELTVV